MLLNLIFIIGLGILTTYEDVKKRIIRNKVVLIALLVAPFLHIYQLIQAPEMISFIPNLIINLIFAVFVGFLIWLINIWPAGDAKLFMAYSFLLPLNVYAVSKNSFISFDYAVNVFVPVFVFMFFLLMLRSKRSEIKETLKSTFDSYRIFMAAIVIVGFLWFFMELLYFFGIPFNYFIIVILLFIIMEFFERIGTFSLELTFIAAAVIRLLIDYRNVFTLGYLYYLVAVLVAFVIFRYFVIELGFKGYTVKKKISELETGMCLAEGIIENKVDQKVGYEKKKITQFSIPQILSEKITKNYIHSISFEGLSKNDVKKIKRLRKEGKIKFNEILVHMSMPFAFFLFLGILMTIFFNGSFMAFLRMLI
ncbi:MAG: hypothetical protein GTN76_07655 [Candidatus Aenigmarchaeota archaeon]|nr:hypothetical protein [Candidatus Aenigmarchaeota archaeon]